MATLVTGQSFAASHIEIAPGLVLSRLAPFEATQLGVICASMDPWARYGLTPGELSAFLAREEAGTVRYGVRSAGQLEGALVVKPDWFAGPYIQFLALAPGVQRRGTGAKLLAFVDQAAQALKSRNVWVAASDFNAGALRFYERHGFQRFAVADSLLRNGRDEVLLRKKLFAS